MRNPWIFGALLAFAFLFSLTEAVQADGIIIPEQPPCRPFPCQPPVIPLSQSPLAVKSHTVTVQIKDQLAVTHVDQIFINTGDSTVEGTYMFPMPADAVVKNFTLWVDGKAVEGKVLSAEQARQTYEDIVRERHDPALLEYIGRGALQASIFPIPSGGERRVELEYTQALTADNGLVKYSYPLNTEKFSALPLEEVSVTVDLQTGQPIRAVYSPSHDIDVNRSSNRQATASYEAENVKPDTDFDLFYSYGDSDALHLFTYRDGRDPADEDGFFMLLAAPSPEAESERIAKDVFLIMDRSGSMEGEKIHQAKLAARYILSHLGPEDRFHLTAFSSKVQHYMKGLSPAEESEIAADWIDELTAGGSTDIDRALLETAEVIDPERPAYLIFLTDGLPTVGVRESRQILKNFDKAAGQNIRLFSFGVGYDVDTLLLDDLSLNHHGISTYVKPEEELDQVLSSFYEKISTPVLTDLHLKIDGVTTYDLFPETLPDLFQGSQLVITGRYRRGGTADILLEGRSNDERQTYRYPNREFIEESPSILSPEASLPHIWAARKIGALLNQIRLEENDRETVAQIVKLSIRYGIVTPYTSYLVTEPLALGEEDQEQLAERTFGQMQAMPSASASGFDAVQKAQEQNDLAQSASAPHIAQSDRQTVRSVGARTFVQKDGIWIETVYNPNTMPLKKIKYLSDEYFELIRSRSDLAACLALGSRVIVVDHQSAIEIFE
ncbi:MAG: VWA domain-containing protein [Leptolinea sp.]|jgi:Ca-activated chloride channel family protein|nr:VWA domain-containing protein [Leptolinea sp.]